MLKRAFFILGILAVGCKDVETKEVPDAVTTWALASEPAPQWVPLAPDAEVLVADWAAFQDFERSLIKLFTAKNREDFELIIEEVIEKQKVLEESDYPGIFDVPHVKGRQKVVKTYLLKIKGDLIYRQPLAASVKELTVAHNALRERFNILVNNVLPEALKAMKTEQANAKKDEG